MNYWLSPWLLIPLCYMAFMAHTFKMNNNWTLSFEKNQNSNKYIQCNLLKQPTRDRLSKMFVKNN